MWRFPRRPELLALFAALALAPTAAVAGSLSLQLEVFRNGEGLGLLAPFEQDAGGRISAEAAELRAIGIQLPAEVAGPVWLSSLPGVSYRYDEARQQIFITATPDAMTPTVIGLRRSQSPVPVTRDVGAVVNYSVAVGAGLRGRVRAETAGVVLEARLFGPLGLVTAGFAGQAGGFGAGARRLDTAWVWSRQSDALTLQAGDLISGGFAWTRPLRLGGLQVRRDFAVRPDLVTVPTPTLSASAAAPSTLEVMLGPSLVLSQRISAGRVEVSGLPVVQGRGEASLVLRDAAGVERQVSAAYFASPSLLRQGLLDFSAELGFARRGFGTPDDGYGADLLASASVRYGWSPFATLQAHAESGAGLSTVGGGISGVLGSFGAASLALSGSRYGAETGGLMAGAMESQIGQVRLSGQAQQTFGDYHDLAEVSARTGWVGAGAARGLFAPPRRLLQASASSPLPIRALARWGETPSMSLALAQVRSVDGRERSMLSGSLRWTIANRVSAYASAYRAAGDGGRTVGAFLGFSLPIGGERSVNAGIDTAAGRTRPFAELRQPERLEPGATAWRVRAEGGPQPGVEAEAVYRSPVGRVAASASHVSGSGTQLQARLDGAVVLMGRPMLARDRIDNAFAVVDVGAPGVEVRHQNRFIGVSGRDGRLLALNLNAYEPNLMGIDIERLPLELSAATSELAVVPPRGAGAWVRFGVAPTGPQASLALRRPDGSPAPAGAIARLEDGREATVGYDGLLFIPSPPPRTVLTVDLGAEGACAADFTLPPGARGMVRVPDAICR